MLLTPGRKRLSVEIEPPKLSSKEASTEEFLEKIRTLSEFSDLVSITNRHTFHMATLTAIKKALTVLRQLTVLQSIGLLMHLTTRVSAIETYKLLQDARDVGVEHFLPLMGDPRGPVAAGFFKNSLDLLRFVSFLSTGEQKFLEQIKDLNYLMDEPPPPIEKNNFQVGTVVDPNPTRWVVNREVEIREKEIKLVDLKVQAGATYFISQAFFLADYFFDFLDNLTEPVEIGAGLIPARLPLTKRIGVPMPFEARKCLQSAVDTNDRIRLGNKISAQVREDLEFRGAKWIHVYSFGALENVYDILGEDSEFLKRRGQTGARKQLGSIFSRSV